MQSVSQNGSAKSSVSAATLITIIMITIVIIIIIIIIIAFKGAAQDLSTISLLRRKLSPTCTLKWPKHNHVKIMCNISSAYQVQRSVCHLV